MTLTLALAGDTMLGRGVAQRLEENPAAPLFDPALVEVAATADLFVLNLECCISDRGGPIEMPGKPFFFRAPPVAAERLAGLGVDAVTLANNHVLDFGPEALADTLAHLDAAGIAGAGAGLDLAAARGGVTLAAGGERLRLISVADHPASYAAGRSHPGIAFVDLEAGGELPPWLRAACGPREGELVLAAAHWGPNMTSAPVPHVRTAAQALDAAGATLIVGHSAHVPHGARGRMLFDLGDFLDDYAINGELRNDLSLLWLVELDSEGPRSVEGVPVFLEYAYTRLADRAETEDLTRLLRQRCAAIGSGVRLERGRLIFELSAN